LSVISLLHVRLSRVIKIILTYLLTNSGCHPSGSVSKYQRKLGSKRAYHAMQLPRIRGLAASPICLADVRLMKRRSAPDYGPVEAREGLYSATQHVHDFNRRQVV